MELKDKINKQRIQRLALLRHAQKCRHAQGEECSVTRHCGMMKDLWQHMIECHRYYDCEEPFCVTSRYILIHYRDCMNAECETCVPVRAAIARDNAISRLSQEEKELIDGLMCLSQYQETKINV